MLSASSGKNSSTSSSSSPKKSEKALGNKLKKDAKCINSKDYEVNLIHGFEDLITGAIICKIKTSFSLSLSI